MTEAIQQFCADEYERGAAAHIVLDLETLSTKPHAAVIAIGAVALDLIGQRVGEFHVAIDNHSQPGRDIDPETVAWWEQQSPEAQAASYRATSNVSATQAMCMFSGWVGTVADPEKVKMWGNGSSFDCTILSSLYAQCHELGHPQPWRWWNDRDVRTISDDFPEAKKVGAFEGIKHHALHDARHEAKVLAKALMLRELPIVPPGYVLADQAMDVVQLYSELQDVWAEANAVGTVIDRYPVLMKKLSRLRDAVGRTRNGHVPMTSQHSDDAAVDRFATAMKAKLSLARAKGRSGWDDPVACAADDLRHELRTHMHKGDPVDVGNFAMMLHQRGESTTRPLPAELLAAIKAAPADATVIEHNGHPVFLNRGDNPLANIEVPEHSELRATVSHVAYLVGAITLQVPVGAEVPQDLAAGALVDLLYQAEKGDSNG